MRLAVISDLHVMGPGEHAETIESINVIGRGSSRLNRRLRRGLNRVRDRFWHWDPVSRQACFHRALERLADYGPDWVVVNGDYGGDHRGVGFSDDHTFESASLVVDTIREEFPGRARFIFGDHDIGKYNTVRRQGGIRLQSLLRGEEELGIPSFWHQELGGFHALGVNSSLLTLHLFLPEALPEEVEEWKRRGKQHRAEIQTALSGLPEGVRIILFCHDPSALAELEKLPEVRRRLTQIQVTVVGHLHTPGLLRVNRMMRHLPVIRSDYPIARIISHGAQGARSWKRFNPVVCPSTYGIGNHIRGGVLFIENSGDGQLRVYRRAITV